jgi:hypothetical protein
MKGSPVRVRNLLTRNTKMSVDHRGAGRRRLALERRANVRVHAAILRATIDVSMSRSKRRHSGIGVRCKETSELGLVDASFCEANVFVAEVEADA